MKPEEIVETEVCAKCGGIFLKERMKAVKVSRSDWLLNFNVTGANQKRVEYYCEKHVPQYDHIVTLGCVVQYYREIECDEQGEPLGYVSEETLKGKGE